MRELCPRCGSVLAEGEESCGCENEPRSARGTDLELDDPRPRPPADFDAPDASPLATRWRVGDQEIVADQHPLNGAVRVWVDGRIVSANAFTLTRADGTGYRGRDQSEARVRFDRTSNSFSLLVGQEEIAPHTAPPPRPAAPSTPATPPSADAPPPALMIVLAVVFVVGFVVTLIRFMARH